VALRRFIPRKVMQLHGLCSFFAMAESFSIFPSTAGEPPASNCVSLGAETALQVLQLFILAIPIACVSWTVTHEAIFREAREFCKTRSQTCTTLLKRKFFYLFTCEYCFSHYVTAIFLAITRFKLLYPDWRGYVISLFSLVWIANQYISIYDRLRLDIKHEHISIDAEKQEVQAKPSAARRDAA
jgi:hypothetical protein